MALKTEREFLNAILSNPELGVDVRTYAQQAIAKLDAKNEKRRNTLTATQKENLALMEKIEALLLEGCNVQVASEIAEALGISTQKASALCGKLVEDGKLIQTEVKQVGKGKVKGYMVA